VGGKLYYKKDLSTDVAIWDKVGTARMYAQWKDCIEIAGIKWAAANVDAPGTFAANEYAYGMLYQFGRGGVGWSNSGAPTSEPFGNMWSNNNGPNNTNWGVIPFDIDPCPDGWSVPTKAELDKLEAKKTTWVTDYLGSGISGYTFTDDPEVLFLPASGWRLNTDGDARDQNRYGMYWSATTILNLGTAYYLRFTNGVVEVGTYYRRAEGFSVRCVRN
jgi:uncharacterized protein (TIGR02145 family)